MEATAKLANQLGRYRLVSTLGQGGMGTIWLAVAAGLGEFRKLLVIKELRWDLTRNHRFVEMFLDEAKLAARLSHPNVVQTIEADTEDDRYFLAMEFLEGQPLNEVMHRAARDPSITLAVRLRILCDALAGLHYAHELRDYDGTELRIVHRDVSPHNVFVTYDGQVKVVDFGIAKAADADTLTQPGMFKGKFAYASPEQIESKGVDRRSDVFSMGVLLWELVTLQRFARGKPTQEAFDARLAGAEPRLSQLDMDVEPLLAEICDRAMNIIPSKRYATAEQLRLAIEQYMFLNGERIDSSIIARIMRKVFAHERAAMHRMIDNHLKAADCSESLVRQLRPLPSDPPALGEEDPTTVADLSQLVESSRDGALPNREALTRSESSSSGFEQALRPHSRKWWIAAGVVLTAAVIALYVLPKTPFGLGKPDDTSVAATPLPPKNTAQLAPPTPVVAAPAPASAPDAPVEQAAAKAPASSVAPEDSESPERRLARRRKAAASDDVTPSVLFGLSAAADDAPSADQPSDEGLSPGSMRVEIPDENADSDAPAVDVGADLRQLRKEERRGIDTEDPFNE